MAKPDHLKMLKKSVKIWNEWRSNHPKIKPDLRNAGLFNANLVEANLCYANLSGTNLGRANLYRANLSNANLEEAFLQGAVLHQANLCNAKLNKADMSLTGLIQANLEGATLDQVNFYYANLREANLKWASLYKASFVSANLRSADLSNAYLITADLSNANLDRASLENATLQGAILNETSLAEANLTNADVYGISAWDLYLENTIQKNLSINRVGDPLITVDNIEVAQFIYLLLNNDKLRDVINTITSKVVLILGRFTKNRKKILDAIREEIRKYDYLPILFDFEKPINRDITETLSILAHIARFIIADITDAKSIPQELKTIVPNLPSVPIVTLLKSGASAYGMFEHFKRFPWVLPVYRYKDLKDLTKSLKQKIIIPAEAKAKKLQK